MTSDSGLNEESALLDYGITRFGDGFAEKRSDALAVEEPLEIRLRWLCDGRWQEEPLTITMRTPGYDRELAAGLLLSEGIVQRREQILALENGEHSNVMLVQLASDHQLDIKRFQRNFLSTSSCGICGKMAIESLQLIHQPQLNHMMPAIAPTLLQSLPEQLKSSQSLFQKSGGMHAAGLFNVDGDLLMLCEDVGRHNAVDKLLGACLLEQAISISDCVLLVSGRAGFEIVQKALAANIALLAAVGAPTSLAIDLARAHGMTLVGFLKADGFNCYSGEQRLRSA